MVSRRKFITGSAAAAATMILSIDSVSCSGGRKLRSFGFISNIIGKELEGNWREVLEHVQALGYTEIETGDYLGDSAQTYVSFLKKTGITPIAGALGFVAKDEDLYKNFTLINRLQMKYSVVYWPWYTGGPFNLEDCKRAADRLNYLGIQCKKHGQVLCWHNHDKEFIPMETGLPFDYLMNNTDSNLVKCELDLYWVKKGGADPLEMLRKYSGRYGILHIKDMAAGPARDFECPGSGIIDFPSVFREAYKQKISHFMVERDNVQDGLACLKSAADYLKKLTF